MVLLIFFRIIQILPLFYPFLKNFFKNKFNTLIYTQNNHQRYFFISILFYIWNIINDSRKVFLVPLKNRVEVKNFLCWLFLIKKNILNPFLMKFFKLFFTIFHNFIKFFIIQNFTKFINCWEFRIFTIFQNLRISQ